MEVFVHLWAWVELRPMQVFFHLYPCKIAKAHLSTLNLKASQAKAFSLAFNSWRPMWAGQIRPAGRRVKPDQRGALGCVRSGCAEAVKEREWWQHMIRRACITQCALKCLSLDQWQILHGRPHCRNSPTPLCGNHSLNLARPNQHDPTEWPGQPSPSLTSLAKP